MPIHLLLVNWRTGESILFNSDHQDLLRFPRVERSLTLFPGHIIIDYPKSNDDSSTDTLRIYSIASLDPLWRPVSEFDLEKSSNTTGIPCVALNVPGNNLRCTPHYHDLRVSVAESLLHDASYDLVVQVQDEVIALRGSVSRHALSTRTASPPIPEPKSIDRHGQHFAYVSAAGYRFSWDTPTDLEPTRLKRIVVRAPDGGVVRHPRKLPMPEADPSGV
ncbi:hypothetical protein FB451DRAFT_1395987 [Mycena latifolia]|nr:hypothetical protein FB451DRAFT_1395987 [Mycena latifolia]